jgi:hypothetical protein
MFILRFYKREDQTCAASHQVKSSQSYDFDFILSYDFILIKKVVPTAQKCAKSVVKYYFGT